MTFHRTALRYLAAAIALVALAAITPAFASDDDPQHTWTVGLHLVSTHSSRDPWIRNDTPGVYVRHSAGATAGVFRNSLGNTSVYAGWTWSLGALDVTAGAITGYQKRRVLDRTDWGMPWSRTVGASNAHISPFAAVSVAAPSHWPIVPRLTYMPKFGRTGEHVLHLSVERSL